MSQEMYRSIPQVEKLLAHPRIARWFPLLSRPLVSRIVAESLDAARAAIRDSGSAPDEASLVDDAEARCRGYSLRRIRRVINATGIILHTNMGRSPLPSSAWDSCREVNTGYSNLELDLDSGRRGTRSGIVAALLGIMTGCEDALVVNNNAASVLLMLSAIASGKEVIVSRGEQVQIGGGFRIPEILALSGARLVEVGTTNITTVDDYASAVTESTGMVLVVHPSNFRIRGFTETPDLARLAAALPPHAILAVDQGSGVTTESMRGETRVGVLLKQGARLVCFSGDKVLGGPQAGMIVGDAGLIRAMARHPLARAFRPGKTIYSLLEQHLVERLNGTGQGRAERVLSLPIGDLERMGRRMLRSLPRERARLVSSEISSGGGSSPDESSPSLAIEITPIGKPDDMLAALRGLPTPIIGVIENDKVLLSLATMFGEDEKYIAASILETLGG